MTDRHYEGIYRQWGGMALDAFIKWAGMHAAIAQTTDGIVVTDANGIIEYVNPAFITMSGYTSEQAVGQSTRIFSSGRHHPAFYEELWNTIRSGRIWRGDIINRRQDGILYEEEMSITPIRDALGAIVNYIAIKHDVSRSRAAGEVRRESELRLLGIIGHAPLGIYMSDGRDGRFMQVNTAFCEMLGYSEHELLATTWKRLIHKDDLERALESSARLWRDACDGLVDTETRYIHHDGNVVWVRVRMLISCDSRGYPQYLVVYLEDRHRTPATDTLRSTP